MSFSAAALISRIEQTIRRQQLFQPGDTLVVALSGGADSTCLLDLLTRLPDYDLRLIVTHLNHCLRADESDADEEFCRQAAARYMLPFEVRRVDVSCMAAELQLNLEDAGRRARIDFLDEVRAHYRASAVVLAHHADDQAETVLMRLLRGSGMTGLSGMAFRNGRGYVRPLLEVSRAEIEQYLNKFCLEWREDASNRDSVYLRNRIRHQLLPLLEEYNPAIRSTFATTATLVRDDETLLEELTVQAYSQICQAGEGGITISIKQLLALHISLQRRVLRHAFKQLTGTLEGVGQHHIAAIAALVDSDRPNARISLPQGVTVLREYDRLVLKRAAVTGEGAGDFELTVTGSGLYRIPGGTVISVEIAETALFPTAPGEIYLDPEKTPFPWLIRTFRAGDRMTPFGMKGRKKVKDIFIDRKIPLAERRRIPLLFSGDELIWIAGVCVSEVGRIAGSATSVFRITVNDGERF